MRERDLIMNLSQNSEVILEVRNVSFGYDERDIISNINLELRDNELVSLLGVSGSGKSTLFNIIAGLLKPDVGNVIYRGDYRQVRTYKLFISKRSSAALYDNRRECGTSSFYKKTKEIECIGKGK